MFGNFLAGFGSFAYIYGSNYTYGMYAGNNWTGGERDLPTVPAEQQGL